MKLTKHASVRKQQRGFSNSAIKDIMKYGNISNTPGDAYKLFLGKKESQAVISRLKQLIQRIDKAKGRTLIVSGEDIVTMYRAKNA